MRVYGDMQGRAVRRAADALEMIGATEIVVMMWNERQGHSDVVPREWWAGLRVDSIEQITPTGCYIINAY